jgi:hypothetical protein
MNDLLRQKLDSVTETPARSKLEPYTDVIRELRRKRKTYQEISRFFAEHLGIQVAPSTIHAFVKVRARRRGPLSYEIPDPNETNSRTADQPAAESVSSHDPIAALRQKPTPAAKKPLFGFNDGDPMPLLTTKDKPA